MASAKRPNKMNDDELSSVLNNFEKDSTAYNSEFMNLNEEYLRRYNRELYGDEEEGFSSVVATDVRDTVESDMTSMIRVFLGSGNVMVFEPFTDNPEDIQEQKLKTQYINHLILKRPGQYKVIHDFLKDAEIQKMGVIHYYMDEVKDTKEIRRNNLSDLQLTDFIESIEAKDDTVSKVDVVSKEEIEGSTDHNITLRVTTTIQDFVTDPIPTEDFLITRNSATLDKALMTGHVSYPTRSELVAGGMSEEEVAQFSSDDTSWSDSTGNQQTNNSSQSSAMKDIRWRDEGGNIIDIDAFSEWSAQTVRMVTMFAKVDYDNDGIAERRRIVKIGDKILENDPYDHVPYALTSCILEPHKAIGNGRASLVVEDQSVNTALQRALLDNTYDASRPRNLLGDGVNIDDFFDHRSDGAVRMNAGSGQKPSESIFPLVTPYIGGEVLTTLQHRNQEQAQRVGTTLDSQGLEADQLNNETATRFNGIEKANEAKIELVARNHAETGFRKLFEGAAWTVTRFQDKKQQIRVMGKALEVDPSEWQYPSSAVSQVGLGAGSGNQSVQQATGIYQIQQQLKSTGSLLVDDQGVYNTLDKMVQGLGLARTSDYFNNPDIPEDMLMAQYQQLVVAAQQMQAQLEQLMQKNPLAEAEEVKAQASLINAQAKSQVEMIKADAQVELKQMEMIQDTAQFDAEQTFKYTELEVENGVDIPGEGVNG